MNALVAPGTSGWHTLRLIKPPVFLQSNPSRGRRPPLAPPLSFTGISYCPTAILFCRGVGILGITID